MKHVQHDQVKQGMTIKDARGIWVYVSRVIKPGEPTYVMASNVNGRLAGQKFQLALYERPQGYELHPKSEMIHAQAHQRAGRADIGNVTIREYSIKFVIVDRVDSQGVSCGYCQTDAITSNIYATVSTESGRTEESAWSTCVSCEIRSIDEVEDVDPAYTITIERVKR